MMTLTTETRPDQQVTDSHPAGPGLSPLKDLPLYDDASQSRRPEAKAVDATTGAAKAIKLARLSLIPPKCIWELAEHYGKGSLKYDDRNWEKGYDFDKSTDALGRHLLLWLMGEEIDEETGSHHLIAAAWHCFCLRTFTETHPEKDTRPKSVELPPNIPELGDLVELYEQKYGGRSNG